MSQHPVLYSYRRCPYAMRARMAICFSGVQVEQREIVFWDKPEPMLQASPKGTVPVLILADGKVIDESRDIMSWALAQSADQSWLFAGESNYQQQIDSWIDLCDNQFKPHLDHYKYADRHPEFPQQHYRQQGEVFLQKLEQQLAANLNQFGNQHLALIENKTSMADIALFPFIRQFANVDKNWFAASQYQRLKQWLQQNLESHWFNAVMKNRPVWQAGHNPLWVDEPELTTKDTFRHKAEQTAGSA